MAQSSPEGIILGKGSTLIKMEVSVNEKPKQETLEEAFEKWADQQFQKGVGYDKFDVLQFGAKWQQEQYKDVNRIEVINHSVKGEGREYVRRNISIDEFSIQDDGKTLKIFLK
jgi:hypothetical protein